MNKNVYLIRHGEVKYPLNDQGEKLVYGPDCPLADLGFSQAKALGKRLASETPSIEVIYTSPYLRAVQTAGTIGDQLSWQLPIIEVKDLHDTYCPGYIGRLLSEHALIRGDIYSHPLTPDQETLKQLNTRALKILKTLAQVLYNVFGAVSHGDFLSALVFMSNHSRLPLSYDEMKKYFYLEKGQAYRFEMNGSGRLKGQGQYITVDEVKGSIENWRK